MNEQFVRDSSRRYANSYVAVKCSEFSETVPIYVRDIGFNDSGVPSLYSICLDGGMEVKHEFNFKEVEILPTPKSRVFDARGITFVYKRKTDRQWTRGISGNNSFLYSPIAFMLECLQNKTKKCEVQYDKTDAWSLEVVGSLFNDIKTPFTMALSLLDSGKTISKTITRNNFISLSPKDGTYLLWYMDRVIASFSPSTYSAEVLEPLYYQEVRDFFIRQGVYYGIKETN